MAELQLVGPRYGTFMLVISWLDWIPGKHRMLPLPDLRILSQLDVIILPLVKCCCDVEWSNMVQLIHSFITVNQSTMTITQS